MPSLSLVPAKQDFFSLSVQAFDTLAIDWGWPKFRANQVRDWVYKKGIFDPLLMTNLSKLDREDNLAVTLDFRRVYSSVLEQWMGTDANAVIPNAGSFGRLQLAA